MFTRTFLAGVEEDLGALLFGVVRLLPWWSPVLGEFYMVDV